MAASGEDKPAGWHPPDERELWDRGTGSGATTGGSPPHEAGSGDPGGGRGTDASKEVVDGRLPNGDLASTREGAPRPAHSPLGWGEEGEHYPSAVAPSADEADHKDDPDR